MTSRNCRDSRQAFCVASRTSGCLNDEIVAGDFAFEIQTCGDKTNEGMENKQGFADTLDQQSIVIAPRKVRGLVNTDLFQFLSMQVFEEWRWNQNQGAEGPGSHGRGDFLRRLDANAPLASASFQPIVGLNERRRWPSARSFRRCSQM